ncbi:hypothetical protein HYR99_42130 [Candidatus Poribacteria bacterium]|nr:hypothetical protein [Candidatus Poribacteria bacterium]
MIDKRLEDLSPEEFQGMMDDMLSDDFDKVTVTEFFGALVAMDEADTEVIELTAHVEGKQLVLEQPAPLPVAGNEIRVYNKRIVIKLRENVVEAA